MSTNPTISVIMSVYNTSSDYLHEAIRSVLQQSYDDFEFIIIDDNSNEETKKVIGSYLFDERIRLYENHDNLGLTKNLNKAISLSKGTYIARMDSDDVCERKRFERQLQFMAKNPDIVVLGTYYYFLKDGRKIKHNCEATSPSNTKARWFFTNTGVMHASVMIKAEVLKNGYLYDTHFKRTQDYDLWTRISKKHDIAVMPEYLMSYRISGEQISTKYNNEQMRYYDEIILRQLDELYSDLDEYYKTIHYNICRGIKNTNSIVVYDWCRNLINRNNQIKMYDALSFKYYALYYCLRNCAKSIHGVRDFLVAVKMGINWAFTFIPFEIKERRYRKKAIVLSA